MELWPYRLAVRTPGAHPGNPGSIPGGVTINAVINENAFWSIVDKLKTLGACDILVLPIEKVVV